MVRTLDELEARGLVGATVQLSSVVGPLARIRARHACEHLDSVRQLGVAAGAAELSVSGGLTAVDAVADGTVRNTFCAIRPPGHHASNTVAEEGYCYCPGAAIAARSAQEIHGYEKVVIIDLYHHRGSATQDAFCDDSSLLFLSVPGWNAHPRSGDRRSPK